VSQREAYDAAKAQFPRLSISFEEFVSRATSLNVSSDNATARAADLCLAWSAGLGDPWAVDFIEANMVATVHSRLRARGAPAATADDVMQTVRAKLLVDRPPRILMYNGTAPLAHWMFVIATRSLIDERRKNRTPDVNMLVDHLVSPTPLPTDLPIDGGLREQARAALKEQLQALPARDRNVLRLHFLEGVSVDAIARTFGVHRVTVARWLWRAGDAIRDGLKETFRDRFGVASQDFDSLVRRLPSQLDYNLSSALELPEPTERKA
jgi:RNA polymerase sigma-70 factor (ECF subfamily)